MTKEEISERYFDWLCGLTGVKKKERLIARLMFKTDFRYSIERDGNRYEDGIEMRYRFGDCKDIDESIIASMLDIFPCSVFEMLAALSLRIEQTITEDPDYGDRTSVWFHKMLENAGLIDIHDAREAKEIIENILDRRYDAYGHGNFFTVKRRVGNMKTTELWYQAMWWLDEQMKLV